MPVWESVGSVSLQYSVQHMTDCVQVLKGWGPNDIIYILSRVQHTSSLSSKYAHAYLRSCDLCSCKLVHLSHGHTNQILNNPWIEPDYNY